MVIALYDPLFSHIGHFDRYNKYLIEILSENELIETIYFFTENNQISKDSFLNEKVIIINQDTNLDFDRNNFQIGLLNNSKIRIKEFIAYRKILSSINVFKDIDYVFFTSQGNFSFWLAVLLKQQKLFFISVISIKWFYLNKGVKRILFITYKKFLTKSCLNIFTENLYADISNKIVLNNNTLTLPDRYLKKINFNQISNWNKVKLSTIGTISSAKSPVEFLQNLKLLNQKILDKFIYEIHGKVKDEELMKEITNLSKELGFSFFNKYISDSEYENILATTDFFVIPYPEEYVRHATSGVMWDCFERGKPIICPNIQPFIYYIDKFKIGYLYTENNLSEVLQQVIEDKMSGKFDFVGNYEKLQKSYTKEIIKSNFSEAISKLRGK